MKRKENIKRISLVLFSAVFCLSIIEVALRIFFPQISDHDEMFQDDALLGWTFIPEKRGAIVYFGEAGHYIQINEAGFRDDSFEGITEGKRIMVIGDSFVSNVSVKDDKVFTEVLETNLLGVNVMNFGVNGYGQVQEMLLLEKWVDQVNPDMVILMVYVRNDFADNIGRGQWNRKKPIAIWDDQLKSVRLDTLIPDDAMAKKDSLTWRIYHNLHLYHFVSKRIINIKSRYKSKNDEQKILPYAPSEGYLTKNEPSEEMKKMEEVMEYLLLKMAGKLKARNIPMLIVTAPSIVQVEDSYWDEFMDEYTEGSRRYERTRPNHWLKQLGEKHDLPVLDLFPVLKEITQRGKMLYNPNEQHWTAEGNRIVAETIERYLRANFSPVLSGQ